jgi:hypothetical protein
MIQGDLADVGGGALGRGIPEVGLQVGQGAGERCHCGPEDDSDPFVGVLGAGRVARGQALCGLRSLAAQSITRHRRTASKVPGCHRFECDLAFHHALLCTPGISGILYSPASHDSVSVGSGPMTI